MLTIRKKIEANADKPSDEDILYEIIKKIDLPIVIMDAFRTAVKKGVDVRIITPEIPDKKLIWLMTWSNYEPLVRDGVKIYEYTPGFIHAKSFACDDLFAVCGTINLDYRSHVHHFECGVWLYKVDAVKDIKTDFMETLA